MAVNNKSIHRNGKRNKAFLLMINAYADNNKIHYYLIVEGDSDVKFFNKLLNPSVCKAMSISDNSNSNKEEVISFIKNNQKQKGFIGIVDADFDNILKRTDLPLPENIIMTDYHDIEMVIIESNPDWIDLYAEVADPVLIEKYEKITSRKFIDSVLDAAYEIGKLRLTCMRKNIINRPSTNMLEFSDCIDELFSVKTEELISRIVKGSNGRCVFEQDLKDGIAFEEEQKHDKYQVCCGHDVTKILEYCFREESPNLGYGKTKRLTQTRIESLLRAIYSEENFKKTTMFDKIIKWQENNTTILKPSLLSE